MLIKYLFKGRYSQSLSLRQGERVTVTFLQCALCPFAARADGLALVTDEQPRWVAEKQLLVFLIDHEVVRVGGRARVSEADVRECYTETTERAYHNT